MPAHQPKRPPPLTVVFLFFGKAIFGVYNRQRLKKTAFFAPLSPVFPFAKSNYLVHNNSVPR